MLCALTYQSNVNYMHYKRMQGAEPLRGMLMASARDQKVTLAEGWQRKGWHCQYDNLWLFKSCDSEGLFQVHKSIQNKTR